MSESERTYQDELIKTFIWSVRRRLAEHDLMERTFLDLDSEILAILGSSARKILLASAQSNRVNAFTRKLAARMKQVPDWSDW